MRSLVGEDKLKVEKVKTTNPTDHILAEYLTLQATEKGNDSYKCATNPPPGALVFYLIVN